MASSEIVHADQSTSVKNWDAADARLPADLGGLSDAVIAGVRLRPAVRLAELGRMAKLTRSGKAVTQGGSWGPGAFVTAYRANRQAASSVALDDSPLEQAMRSLAKYHSC